MILEALRAGPQSYDDLLAMPALELSRRSLQLYLEKHLPAAGFVPTRGITRDFRPRATFRLTVPEATVETRDAVNRAALALARGVLADLFPLEGTDLEPRPPPSPVLAIASGVPRFEVHHQRALLQWIALADGDPPGAAWLRYRGARNEGDDDEPRRRLVWPLGVILRDGRRVYLPALVEPANSLVDRRLFALERVVAGPKDCGVEAATEDLAPTPDFLRRVRPRLRDLVQPGFGVVRPESPATRVELHIAVAPPQAPYLRGRRWHPRQHEVERHDGGIELRFGPVALDEAVGWCSQWSDGVTVLGDARLREAYEASLTARLARQRATPRRRG